MVENIKPGFVFQLLFKIRQQIQKGIIDTIATFASNKESGNSIEIMG